MHIITWDYRIREQRTRDRVQSLAGNWTIFWSDTGFDGILDNYFGSSIGFGRESDNCFRSDIGFGRKSHPVDEISSSFSFSLSLFTISKFKPLISLSSLCLSFPWQQVLLPLLLDFFLLHSLTPLHPCKKCKLSHPFLFSHGPNIVPASLLENGFALY